MCMYNTFKMIFLIFFHYEKFISIILTVPIFQTIITCTYETKNRLLGCTFVYGLIFHFISGTLFAQKVVTGTVTNSSNNQPIPSATVTVKGTNIGAAT